jgi:hypothetical protein
LKLSTIVILALLFILPVCGIAASSIPEARTATHLIFPFIGNQYLNGDKTGMSYTYDYVFPQDTSHYHLAANYESSHDSKAPIFGVAYRYRFSDWWLGEASIAMAQNEATYKYGIKRYYLTYVLPTLNIKVAKKTMMMFNLEAIHEFDSPLSWLGMMARVGVGYAWRSVEVGVDDPAINAKALDAQKMFTFNGGVDFSLWKGDALMLDGALTYTQFMPISSDAGSFGGIGWRIGVFPIWGE